MAHVAGTPGRNSSLRGGVLSAVSVNVNCLGNVGASGMAEVTMKPAGVPTGLVEVVEAMEVPG